MLVAKDFAYVPMTNLRAASAGAHLDIVVITIFHTTELQEPFA